MTKATCGWLYLMALTSERDLTQTVRQSDLSSWSEHSRLSLMSGFSCADNQRVGGKPMRAFPRVAMHRVCAYLFLLVSIVWAGHLVFNFTPQHFVVRGYVVYRYRLENTINEDAIFCRIYPVAGVQIDIAFIPNDEFQELESQDA